MGQRLSIAQSVRRCLNSHPTQPSRSALRARSAYRNDSLLFANKILFATLILAVPGWLIAFIGQAAAESREGHVGTVWFGIFVQLFLILGVVATLASDSIGLVRLQISAWTIVALVFSVIGINAGIYSDVGSLKAMAAGYFILTIVNVIWLFFFTAEEDSPVFNLFYSIGGGGALRSSGGRKGAGSRNQPMRMAGGGSMGNGSSYGGGYPAGPGGYQQAYGQSPSTADITAEGATKLNPMTNRSGTVNRSVTGGPGSELGAHSIGSPKPSMPAAGTIDGHSTHNGEPAAGYGYKARALYAYTANADDPTEISFTKGEILDIVDNSGKWWQARKASGETGIVPSNYMQLL